MNRADALQKATQLLIAEVELAEPGDFDAWQWAQIVAGLRFGGGAPIVVEVAQ